MPATELMMALHPRRPRFSRLVPTFAALSAAALLAGCGSDTPDAAAQSAPPPPAVVVEEVVLKDLLIEVEFTGRIEAIDKVQIRARVQGFLKARNFVEGAEVEKGQVLFEIEPDTYEIAQKQAEANVASANAALTLAKQTFTRTEELASRNASSRDALDTARSQLAQAQATVQAQQAALQSAKLNLSYTRITAPMPGRVGRTTYSVGNLVGPDSNPLLTVVAQDPMYVTFPVPQSVLLEVRKAGRGADSADVHLRLADGTVYEHTGAVNFVDVQATASTDSVIVRASMPNPKRLLIDQQLAAVRVVRKEPDQRLVIPQAAMVLDQQGAYVLAVDAENKVVIKRITTGEQHGPLLVVSAGLQAGDRVIISGHQKVRPGAVVAPSLPSSPDGAASAPAKE